MKNTDILTQIKTMLMSPDKEVRIQAIKKLREIKGKESIELLSSLRFDSDPKIRQQAVIALGYIGGVATTDPIIGYFSDPIDDVRGWAAAALETSDEVSSVLRTLILDETKDPLVRENAMWALHMQKITPEDMKILTDCLNNKIPLIRQAAASSLGEIGDTAVVNELINALGDTHADVRWTAAFSLGQLDDKSSVPALIHALNDPDFEVREGVIMNLGYLGDARAEVPLMSIFEDSSIKLRRSIILSLRDVGTTEALNLLTEISNDNTNELQEYAQRAINGILARQKKE